MYVNTLHSYQKSAKIIISVIIVVSIILSTLTCAYAEYEMPAPFYITDISINGGTQILADSSGQFGINFIDENVPVNSTFKIGLDRFKVFLFRGCFDPQTGLMSTNITNRDLVLVQTAKDQKNVEGVIVSNENDPDNTGGGDSTVNVSFTRPLDYDTEYQLVVKKYFAKVNQTGEIKGCVQQDVVILFKTAAQPKPTVSKAEVRGSNLRLEGLPFNQNLQYQLSVDGSFGDSVWKALSYQNDIANIDISDTSLNENSRIMLGYSREDGSAPTTVSTPASLTFVIGDAPSFSGAIYDGNHLTLQGLPSNAVGLEYRIAPDGLNFSDWKDLAVVGTKASVPADGLNLVSGKSIVEVRYKESASANASEAARSSIEYSLSTACTLENGTDTLIAGGVKISPVTLNVPGEGEANTVNVRNAAGEKLPTPNNMGFVEGVDSYLKGCGGVYGFSFKGAGNGADNHVKISIPFSLPTTRPEDEPANSVLDSSKVSIYVLTEFPIHNDVETWQYWKLLPTVIDDVNKTATVDISGFNSAGTDVVLAVKYDVFPPGSPTISPYTRTDNSITLLLNAGDWSGIKEMEIKRVNLEDSNDVQIKTITYQEYPGLIDTAHGSWIQYTDTDPEPGVMYEYSIYSYTDMLGNKSMGSVKTYATTESMEDLLTKMQEVIYSSLQKDMSGPDIYPRIYMGTEDSQDFLTQQLYLPDNGISGSGLVDIDWSSDNPDIIKIGNFGITQVDLPVNDEGNSIEKTVTLTGTITCQFYHSDTKTRELATGTVTVPLKVKWKIVNGEVIVTTKYEKGYGPDKDEDGYSDFEVENNPLNVLQKAVGFDNSIADTVVMKHTAFISQPSKMQSMGAGATVIQGSAKDYVIDGHGKTIKADFDGALFKVDQQGGSFVLKNAVIDMNHKAGTVFLQNGHGYQSKTVFENVKIINAENCDYGIVLQSSASSEGKNSFTAKNCEFNGFRIAAIAAYNDEYQRTYNGVVTKTSPVPVVISNCTFNGGDKPGYGILDAFGSVTVENSTFSGYKGNVATGWNSGNNGYETGTTDAEGNYRYLYKGLPDNAPSAAILVKEMGIASISNNTISDCEKSILIWTGESNFSFLAVNPGSGYTASSMVNGVLLNSSDNVSQLVNNLFMSNTISAVEGSDRNKVLIENAANLYNRTLILTAADTIDGTSNLPVWPSESALTYSNLDETYLTISWTPAEDAAGISCYRIYNRGVLLDTVDGATTHYTAAGLTPGTQQFFKVEAVNTSGLWSSNGPSLTIDTLPPAPPVWPVGSELRVTETGPTHVVLSWTPAQDKTGIFYYNVSYKEDKSDTSYGISSNGNINSIKITGLKPNTKYSFNVTARDNSNLYSKGPEVAAATTSGEVSAWAQSSKLYATNITARGMTLYWDSADCISPSRSGTGYYRIYCNGQIIAEQSQSSFGFPNDNVAPRYYYQVTGLSPSKEYEFKVEYDFKEQGPVDEVPWSTDGPRLKVHTTDSAEVELGTSMDISATVSDKSQWASAVKDIKLYDYRTTNLGYITLADTGISLKGRYSVAVSDNAVKIHIDGSAFVSSGKYILSIEAEGYPPINLMQQISVSSLAASFIAPVPVNGKAFGVLPDKDLKIAFNAPLNPGSITSDNVLVEKTGISGSEKIPCSYSLSEDGKTATVHPDLPFVSGGSYKITVGTGIRAVNGAALSKTEIMEFHIQSFVQPAYRILKGNDQVYEVEKGKKFTLEVTLPNKSSLEQSATVYMVLRGGMGARSDHGGYILAKGEFDVTAGAGEACTATMDFVVPSNIETASDMSGSIYGDIYVWNENSAYPEVEPIHFVCNLAE